MSSKRKCERTHSSAKRQSTIKFSTKQTVLPTPSETMSEIEPDTIIQASPETQAGYAAASRAEREDSEPYRKRRRVIGVKVPAFASSSSTTRLTDPVSSSFFQPLTDLPMTRRSPAMPSPLYPRPSSVSAMRDDSNSMRTNPTRTSRPSSDAYTETMHTRHDDDEECDQSKLISSSEHHDSNADESADTFSVSRSDGESEEEIAPYDCEGKARKSSLMHNLVNRTESRKGVREDLPPLSNIRDIFDHLTAEAVGLGLHCVTDGLGGRPLRIATMCSGTESPLLALEMIRDSLRAQGHSDFSLEHVFSAEIEPFKQSYIERNFHPPIIFRDIVEMTQSDSGKATTAYGAKVTIPDNVDIAIAGTSCVDFSSLNRRKKGLDDQGESSDTFTAVLNYAKKYRPRVLILENVYNAPWDSMIAKYEASNYSATGVHVDTKEYYLPQTRTRGYMICIDRKNSGLGKRECAKIGTKWRDVMEALKRPVSAPISSFLFPNDDGEVILSRDRVAKQSHLDPILREVDWSKCEERHKNYRQSARLGTARPYTSWDTSGTLVISDYADTAWHRRQVERVWDVEECSLLRRARQYDVQFKTRIWDLSQNIDRFTDNAPFGISPCLTPSGNFFLTDRGGPLTFAEALALQGLPMEKLEFVSGTERQVQDLAGNAMSTTVVGASLAAALISAGDVLTQGASSRKPKVHIDPTKEAITITGHDQLVKHHVRPSNSIVNIAQMTKHAAFTEKKCYCEGQIGIAASPIQKCVACNHTTCVNCGIKPVHDYQSVQSPRQPPQTFIQDWRSKLPMRLRLIDTTNVYDTIKRAMAKGSPEISFQNYYATIQKALGADYKFSHFRRSSNWTINYKAQDAKLVLTIDSNGSSWSLFAAPDPSLKGNDPLRRFLRRPVAQRKISKDLIAGCNWEWLIPKDIVFDLDMIPLGIRVPAWTARLNLPGATEELCQTLRVEYVKVNRDWSAPCELREDVSGVYEHLKHCGTACEALYRRTEPLSKTPLFLFLDPTRLGQGKDDEFVFSTNPERLQYDETRDVIARVDHEWRPWNDVSATKGRSDSCWRSDGQMSLQVSEAEMIVSAHTNKKAVSRHQNCRKSISLATCEFTVSNDLSKCFTGLHQIQANDKSFFNTFAFAIEPIRPYIHFANENATPSSLIMSCNTCAPPMPTIQWGVLRTSTKEKTSFSMRPIEDPQSATLYEMRLKERPSVFVVQSSIKKNRGIISFGFNHLALAQRAYAKLQKSTAMGYQSTSWSLDTAFSKSLVADLPKFSLPRNDPNESFAIDLPCKLELFPKQQQSLAWMRLQEAGDGKEFVLEAVEEAILPHAGWRAEACAKATVRVRGGIAADYPGFGKTITSLALIHAEFNEYKDSPASKVIGRMKDVSREMPARKIAATLVVLPSTIVKQWSREIEKVLGKEYLTHGKTLVIETMAHLKKYNMGHFDNARIILLNREILGRDTYLQRLARFAGIPQLPPPGCGSAKREFKTWLDLAVQEVRTHLEIMKSEGTSALVKTITRKFQDRLNNNTMRTFANLNVKRQKGKAYEKQRTMQRSNEDEDDKSLRETYQYNVTVQELDKTVLFEMFHYNRIIVDEFSYILNNKGGLFTSIVSLLADKRWCLSATPPLRDPCDVSKLAGLLGINLPGGLNIPGMITAKNLETMQEGLTNVEWFETFCNAPSHMLQRRVHENAQKFLNEFVRQNILTFEESRYDEFLVPVHLITDHRIVYTELLQHLSSQDMRIRKLKSKNVKGQDKQERIHEATNNVQDAESALSNRATFFSISTLTEDSNAGHLLAKRNADVTKHRETLMQAIQESKCLHIDLKRISKKGNELPCDTWQMNNLTNNDFDIVEEVQKMIKGTTKITPHTGEHKPQSTDESDDAPGSAANKRKHQEDSPETLSKAQNSVLSRLMKTYTIATRSARFVENAQDLQKMAKKRQSLPMCGFEDCAGDVDPSKAGVSSECGHIVCDTCMQKSQERTGMCGARGCTSTVRKSHLLHISKMLDDSKPHTKAFDQGRKVETVIDILRDIKGHGEQAILFVRRKEDIERMETVLTKNNITCLAINNDVSKRIKRFQDDTEHTITVIILNTDDESAAGSNLVGANHVIFLSPILKQDQYEYD